MGYSIRTLNYLERTTLSDPTHMMNMTDLVAIGVETLRIDNGHELRGIMLNMGRIHRELRNFLT